MIVIKKNIIQKILMGLIRNILTVFYVWILNNKRIEQKTKLKSNLDVWKNNS